MRSGATVFSDMSRRSSLTVSECVRASAVQFIAYLIVFFLLACVVFCAPAADISLGPSVIVSPGGSLTVPLSLNDPAPPGGLNVMLSSSAPDVVTVSSTNIYIPGGLTTPYALPALTGAGFGTAVITASAFGLTPASLTVSVAASSFGPSTQSIAVGTSQNLTFSLSGTVPTSVNFLVTSDNPGVATVPASITAPPGSRSLTVPVSAMTVGTSTIHVSAPPYVSESTVMVSVFSAGTINLPSVSLTLGQSLPFPIVLATPAPTAGVVVQLASSDPLTVALAPTSVFIPAGQTVPAFQPEVEGSNIGVATITASATGYLTVGKPVPVTASITISPQTLRMAVGSSQPIGMALSAAAPSIGVPITPDRAANGYVSGLTVQLSSSNTAVATVQPSVQFYPDGSSITTVVVLINAVGPGTAIIHAGAPPFIPDTTAAVVVGSSGGTPVSITAVSGTPQSTQVNAPFGLPLSALVQDASSSPVAGATVTFAGPSMGAGVTFGNGNTAVTDSSGIARLQGVSANALSGTYQMFASVAGVAAPAPFALTNLPAALQSISLPSGFTIGTNQSLPYPVGLTAPAPPAGVTVVLSSSDSATVTIVPSSVFITAGATAPAVQPQVIGVNFGSASIGASSSGFVSASQLVQVTGALSFSPPSATVNVGTAQSLTLSLSSPSPAGGLTVSTMSSNPIVMSVPPSAFIPPNATSTSILVTGVAAGAAVLNATAAAPNVTPSSANVTVLSGIDITLPSGVTIGPGETALYPVFLTRPARAGGVTVSLSGGNASIAKVTPDNLYFPEGATAPLTQPQVSGISIGSAPITASAYGLSTATQTVQVVGKLSGPLVQTIQQGASANLMFVLSWPTAASINLPVVSDTPSVATVPAGITVPAGATTVVVPVQAVGPGTTGIHVGALPDVAQSTVTVTVVAQGTITIPSGLSIALGQSAAFPVTLGTPAPPGGLVVTLTSADASAVAVSPSTIFFAAGATTSSVQPVVTGINIGAVTLSSSAPGYLTATQSVGVTATITTSPATLVVPAGSSRLFSIILSAAAPSPNSSVTPDRAANGFIEGLTVYLSSSNTTVATVQPSVLFYSDGSSVTTVVVAVNGIAPGTTVIHAGAPPFIADATVSVTVQ